MTQPEGQAKEVVEDWKGAYLSLERQYMQRIGWLYAFAGGLEDHAPAAAYRITNVLGVGAAAWAAEPYATRKRYGLPPN